MPLNAVASSADSASCPPLGAHRQIALPELPGCAGDLAKGTGQPVGDERRGTEHGDDRDDTGDQQRSVEGAEERRAGGWHLDLERAATHVRGQVRAQRIGVGTRRQVAALGDRRARCIDHPDHAAAVPRDAPHDRLDSARTKATSEALLDDGPCQREALLLPRTQGVVERPRGGAVDDESRHEQDDDKDRGQQQCQAHGQGSAAHHGCGSMVATSR